MANTFTDAYKTYSDCIAAIAHAGLTGDDPAQLFGADQYAEMVNFVSSVDFERKADTPAKDWWNADAFHPAIARALKVDKGQTGAIYALAPFRLYHDGERHLILAAYPCPRILGPIDMDWLGIETVFAWNPLTDEAEVLGDRTPGLFGGDLHEAEAPTVFASPREFFTAWMMARAAYYVRLTSARGGVWQTFADVDACPGKLAIGPIDKIQWSGLPREFEARGFDARKLNRTILRQANLPRAFANQQRTAV